MADERPRAETLSSTGPAPVSPAELPVVAPECYELGPEIARGGLGRLLRARDVRLGRVVALKLLRLRSAHLEARFRREARITARLQHPGIVPIHEAGVWPDGEPFYAMKLVAGESLKAVVATRATLDERLALVPNVLAVAEAMAYAHAEGVIHRDLKPSNVMLGAFGETVVIDWGLAKELAEKDDEHGHEDQREVGNAAPGLTVAGHVLGTAEYLPPEQARGEPVGPGADVYALGSMLYFVLAGRPPYDGADAAAVIAKVRAGAPVALEEREPGVPPELLAIVAKAMAREAAQRYPDAGAMAADLRLFLTGKLVGAHRYSRRVLLWRWMRRNRAPLQVGLAALAALALLLVISVRRIVRARDAARASEAGALAANLNAERRLSALMLAQAEAALPRDPTAAIGWLKNHARSRAPDPEAMTWIAREAAARGVARHVLTGLRLVRMSPDGHTLAAVSDDRLVLIDSNTLARRDLGPAVAANDLSFSGDGQKLALSADEGVTIWPVTGGAPVALPLTGAAVRSALDHTGRTVACRVPGSLLLFHLEDNRRIEMATEPLIDLVLSPDGRHLLGSGFSGAWLWDLDSRRRIALPRADGNSFPVLSPRGERVAWASADGTINLHDIATGKDFNFGTPGPPINSLAFSPDGASVASAGDDGILTEWTIDGEAYAHRTVPNDLGLLSYSPDGARLVAIAGDRVLRIWQHGTNFMATLPPARGRQDLPMWGDGGRQLVTAGSDGEVRIWRLPAALTIGTSALVPPRRQIGVISGRGIAIAAGDGRILVMDPSSGRASVVGAPGQTEQRIAVAPVGGVVLSTGKDGVIRHYDLAAHSERLVDLGLGAIQALVFAPDGQTFAAVVADHKIVVLSASGDGQQLTNMSAVGALTFSPDSSLLALAALSTRVRLFDLATHQDRVVLRGSESDAGALAFSADGEQLASGGGDGVVRMWSTRSGELRQLPGHKGRVNDLVFSADGKLLFTASIDYTARIWDVASASASASARVLRHPAPVICLALSPDGKLLATGDNEGVLRLWDVASGRPQGVWRQHVRSILRVVFSSDGKYAVSSGVDTDVHSVRVPDAVLGPTSAADLDQLSSAVLDPSGLPVSPAARD